MGAAPSARASGTGVRLAAKADADALAKTLTAAFYDDPLMCHFVPREAERPAKLPRTFKFLFKLAAPYGACHVTDHCEAASFWRPPGKWHMTAWQYLANAHTMLGLFGKDVLGVIKAVDAIEKVHPKAAHWYLQTIGADPAFQGKGYGSLLMRHQLAAADAARIPCYLESSKDSNIPIYQSFGFAVTGEIKIPDGPTIYPMWRDVRA